MSAFLEETVLSVHHWTDRLFSFTTTRDPALRFSNGHFTMIGLMQDNGKPLLRAYSIVSANYEEHLEFLSIKVQDGPLTSKLQHIKVGDKIVIGRKPTGTLLIDYLLPGKNLYLLGSGTGLAPFLSVARDPETYEKFEKVIVVHNGCDSYEPARHEPTLKELRSMGKKFILYHGRISIQKGVDYFIHAARKVVDVDKNIVFIVSGWGDMLPQIIEQVGKMGLSENVQ
jgi:ferredoxin--NADP+ reductase